MIDTERIQCEAAKRSQAAASERSQFLREGISGRIPDAFNSPVELVENPFDIENLRYHEECVDERRKKTIYLTPSNVRAFVDEINSLETSSDKPFVISIGTG